MTLVSVVNGPNLNRLGSREPGFYGKSTIEEVMQEVKEVAVGIGVETEFFQSNHEGAIIDYLQEAAERGDGLIINPGALTHYGYSLRDALANLTFPIIEVHISNIYAREEWRSISVISGVTTGIIAGLGVHGYSLAV